MEKITGWLQRAWIVLLIAGVVIVSDQLTKEWVRQTIPEYTSIIPVPALGEYFVFEHVRNYGAAFGILQNQSMLFVAIAFVVAIAIWSTSNIYRWNNALFASCLASNWVEPLAIWWIGSTKGM